jgi:hypothetical protein
MDQQREHSDGSGLAADTGNIYHSRGGKTLPLRVPHIGSRNVWTGNRAMGRQKEREMKIREWASDNAYGLIFLSLMFFLTWVVVGLVNCIG